MVIVVSSLCFCNPIKPEKTQNIQRNKPKTAGKTVQTFALKTYENVTEIKNYIEKHHLKIDLVNARFIKPIDKTMLNTISKKYKNIFIVSDDIRQGGLEDSIVKYLNDINSKATVKGYGIEDEYVPQGKISELKKMLHIDIDYCMKDIRRSLNAKKSKH